MDFEAGFQEKCISQIRNPKRIIRKKPTATENGGLGA